MLAILMVLKKPIHFKQIRQLKKRGEMKDQTEQVPYNVVALCMIHFMSQTCSVRLSLH